MMEEHRITPNVRAVVSGAVATLFLGVITFVILGALNRVPLLLAALAAFLCSLVGGYISAQIGQNDPVRLGAVSGFAAGLTVFLLLTIISSAAVSSTFAGALLMSLWASGGGAGGYLRQIQSLRKSS